MADIEKKIEAAERWSAYAQAEQAEAEAAAAQAELDRIALERE